MDRTEIRFDKQPVFELSTSLRSDSLQNTATKSCAYQEVKQERNVAYDVVKVIMAVKESQTRKNKYEYS